VLRETTSPETQFQPADQDLARPGLSRLYSTCFCQGQLVQRWVPLARCLRLRLWEGGGSFKRLVEQMKSGALDEDESDDKTFKYELVSSVGGEKKDW